MPKFRQPHYAQETLWSPRNGFTLIELLVVIAIIAILAATLMVSLAAAKSRVDKVVCMNNLHHYSIATALYVQDVHVYPLGYIASHYIRPYMKAALPGEATRPGEVIPNPFPKSLSLHSVWICPGYVRVGALVNPFLMQSVAYGYNYQGAVVSPAVPGPLEHPLGLGGDWSPKVLRPVPEEEVLVPTEMVQWGDAVLIQTVGQAPGQQFTAGNQDLSIGIQILGSSSGLWNTALQAAARRSEGQRHGGRFNMVFCDTHVESLRPHDVFTTTNLTAMQRWNRDHQPHPELLH